MTLSGNAKQLTFELVLDKGRNTVEVISQIATTLHVAIGEQPQCEYVQLRHVKHLQEQEVSNA